MDKETKYYLYFEENMFDDKPNKIYKIEIEKIDFSQTDEFVIEYQKGKFVSFNSYRVIQNISDSYKEFILQPIGIWSLSESNEYNPKT